MPNLSGRTLASLDPEQIAQRIRSAIARFEPRLSRVQVTHEPPGTDAAHTAALVFRIEAELWGWPTTQALTLSTSVDLNNGQVDVADRKGG
jgi:type VI secretion system protein ImpF